MGVNSFLLLGLVLVVGCLLVLAASLPVCPYTSLSGTCCGSVRRKGQLTLTKRLAEVPTTGLTECSCWAGRGMCSALFPVSTQSFLWILLTLTSNGGFSSFRNF